MTKTVLITGASRGLGKQFAKLFAKDNYDLILTARTESDLMALKKEIERNYGVSVQILLKDLASSKAAEEIYGYLKESGSEVDILINNAGFATNGLFTDLPLEEEIGEIQLNITSLTVLTKLIGRDMVKKGRGKILNIASMAAFQPGPYMAVYYATKAYVISFSEALSEELKGTGVTVTALCPGPIKTGFASRAKMENSILFNSNVMTAETVALAGFKGLMAGKRVVIPGLSNKISLFLFKFVPHFLLLRAIKKVQD